MRGIVIVHKNQVGVLELRDLPEPVPGPQELLVRVKAAGLNRADLYQRQGSYSPAAPASGEGMPVIAGLEAAGFVTGIGIDVSGFTVGDRVMGVCTGGYAEFTTLDYRLAIPVPPRLSWEEAATMPLACMTGYNALVMSAGLRSGEAVLVNAASSGVGVLAIQIAKLWGGEPVMGMSGLPAKLEALKNLGMDIGINYHTEDFGDATLRATADRGTDVIIDHVGGPYLEDNLRCMALKGRLVSVGRLGGTTAELDLELLARKRLQIIGVTFRTRTVDEKIAIARGVIADLLPPLADGRLKPIIDRVFSLEQAAQAQSYMASNVHFGKIVLKV